MAEKEDYIVISKKDFDYKKGHYVTHLAKQITREEVIETIAFALCSGNCEKCTDGPKGSEHCIKWLEFRGTMEKAETALNALLGE